MIFMWLCKSMSESSRIIFVLPCNKGVVTMHVLNKPLDGLRAPGKVECMFVPKHVLHSSLSYLIPPEINGCYFLWTESGVISKKQL